MRWKSRLCASLLAVSLVGLPVSVSAETPSQQNLDTLTKVYTLLVEDHYTHPDQDALLKAAISGMLSQINDPFTTYFTPDQYKQFTNTLNQTYAGIGVAFENTDDNDGLTIDSVYAKSPAETAGLKPGDRVVQVDDFDVKGHSAQEITSHIMGAPGTNVTLKVVHADGSVQSYTITRAQIELPEVVTQDLGSGIGYLRIFSFGERTTDEFEQQFADLQKRDSKGLVLDLRGNGGGYVNSALQIADDLLQQGTIVIFHNEDGQSVAVTADSAGSNIPLVVLVDRHTASASEMLAGALQKNGRAKLVGERTFGKGTMQAPTELPNGGYIKVSIDQWDLADGKTPDHVGLTPDIHVNTPTAVLNTALQQLLPDRQQTLTLSRTQGTGQLNGNDLLDAPPVQTVAGQVYVPLRYTVETLGNEVDWVQATQEIKFKLEGHQVDLDVTHKTLCIDGTLSHLANPFVFIDGATYLSTDAFKAITGHDVQVTDQSVTVTL